MSQENQQEFRYVKLNVTKHNEKVRKFCKKKYDTNEEYREKQKKNALERYYRIKAEKEAEKQLQNNV